ncbi:MAG: cyanoexosortase B system-associated protein [Cyanobacteria bacterium P01_A01_bin.123]
MQLVKTNPNFQRLIRIMIVALLAAIAVIAAVPHYLNGQWPWTNPLEVAELKQLQSIQDTGLEIQGWAPLNHQVVSISGHDWTLMEFEPSSAAPETPNPVPVVTVLTHAQTWYKDQPEVEWIDLAGTQKWQTDSYQTLAFKAKNAESIEVPVTARFLRSWNDRQTFAVVQWYAWINGGHPSPGQWFFADQRAQWGDRVRMPWVAVSVLIPIEPLGKIRAYETFALDISQAVQKSLNAGPLAKAMPKQS